MQRLVKQIQECNRCEISKQTKHKTIGKGAKRNVKVLFVGLNPGKEENETGIPFVGSSGKLLNRWIDFLGLDPTSYAVVNLIKCYTPTQDSLRGCEATNCFPFLERQIQTLNPDYIVTLGDIVYRQLVEPLVYTISTVEGNFMPSKFKEANGTIFVMKHPSYYLRQGGIGWRGPLKMLAEVLGTVDAVESANQKPNYIPLHVHSEYSITDGSGTTEDLVKQAKDMGFRALALTDHGTIAGWYEFQKLCEENEVRPILGIEFYVTTHYDNKSQKRYHLVALAKNQEGIKNLLKLNTIANVEGYYYKPRITLDDIIEHKEGLVVLTACTSGVISQRILDGDVDEAYEVAELLKKEFGDDFYIELQNHYFTDQLTVNKVLLNMIEEMDIKPIISCDVHYRTKEQKELHNAIKAISFKKKYGEVSFEGDTHCLLSFNELRKTALRTNITKDIFDQAVLNTKIVASKCRGKLEKYKALIPKFEVPI